METYYCFCDGARPCLRWLKKGFRHVFVAMKYGECFFTIEDSFNGFYPNLLLEKDFFLFTKLNKCSILIMDGNKPAKKKFGIWYWAPTCVNFAKTVGNLRTKAQTPWQLYKYLLKKGARKWVDIQDKSPGNKLKRKLNVLPESNKQSSKQKKKQPKQKQKP